MINSDPATRSERKSHLGADLVAGLSIAGLLLPEAVAYSGIAGLPPQAGIIALFTGLACYGLLGRSRFAIVAATSSSAAVLGAATTTLASQDPMLRIAIASALVLLTGLYFLIAGLTRLGTVTDFIAKPVLRGFTFGIATVIAIHQIALLTGIHPRSTNLPLIIWQLIVELPQWHWLSVAIGLGALLLLSVLKKIRRVPAGLVVIALGMGATQWLNLPSLGVDVVGTIDLDIPSPRIPILSSDQWLRLAELAFAMVMVIYSESYGAIRSVANLYGDRVTPNRDLLALGVSNVASALLMGLPVGAGYSATSTNEAAGATSRWAGGIAWLVVLAIVAFVLPSIALIPQPVLAAVVIHGISHALTPGVFKPYFIVWKRDRLVVLASISAVLLLGVLDGLLAGVALSLIMLLRRIAQSRVVELGQMGGGHDFISIQDHPSAQPIVGILILRPEEPLFFANVDHILEDVQKRVATRTESIQAVVLSLEETFDLDSSSLEALQRFFHVMQAMKKPLALSRLKHPVHQVLDKTFGTSVASPLFSGRSVDETVSQLQLRLKNISEPG
jgi:MFS superfamily sulfate permease-like transporter